MDKVSNIIIGLGEIGAPLFEIIKDAYPDALAIDPLKNHYAPWGTTECDFLHICIPGDINSFREIVKDYIDQFTPYHVLIHSSIAPGTTRSIDHEHVWHTPVIGKHANMAADMLKHPKFVSAIKKEALDMKAGEPLVFDMLNKCGFNVQWIGEPENAELGKLLSTTLFGYLIAWAQEAERLSNQFGAEYPEVKKMWELVESADYDIKGKFGGVIGGHCVLPNIALLKDLCKSDMLNFIESSNKHTVKELKKKG